MQIKIDSQLLMSHHVAYQNILCIHNSQSGKQTETGSNQTQQITNEETSLKAIKQTNKQASKQAGRQAG